MEDAEGVISDEAGTDECMECDGNLTMEAQSLEPATDEDDGKKMSGYELERTQEQSRLRDREFQEELRRLTEAEKLQQGQLELMAKRAQEKLEQECLLQQELIYNLKRRVEEERKMRNEEQKKIKEEQQRRKMEDEEKRKKENEERRKREEEKIKRKNLEEVIRRKKEDEARRKVEMRNKEEEERRKMEEEEKREKDEKEKSKTEGEGEKHERKKWDVMKRAHEEEDRKTKETVKKEEEAAVEERKHIKAAEQVKMKVAERKNKEECEKIKKEEEGKNEDIEKMKEEEGERRNKEQGKIKTEEERINKEVEKVKKMEEERKNREAVERIRLEEEERKNKVEKIKKELEEIKDQEEAEIKEEEERKNEDVEKMKEKQKREKEEVERKNVDEEKKRKMEDEAVLENEGWRKNKEEGKKREEENMTVYEKVRLTKKKEEEESDGNGKGRKDEGTRLKTEEKNRKEEEEQKGKESNQKEMEEEGWKEEEEEEKQKTEEAAKSKEGDEDYRKIKEETKEVKVPGETEGSKTSDVSCGKEENERNVEDDEEDKKETQEGEGENKEEINVRTDKRRFSVVDDGTEVREEGQGERLHEEIQVEKHLQLEGNTHSVPPPTTEPHDLDFSRTQTMVGDGPERPSIATPASGTFCLPENTEHKRLAWMEDCVSWSRVSLLSRRKQRGCGPSGRRPRRAEGAGTLAPLPPDALMQDTGWRTLKEVTTVDLRDVSSRSFSTVAQCRRLRSLTLRRCGLKALEDVSRLPELCYVDVQENEISFVDCENMTSLRVLRLGHNKLTSIHGLRGVENLDVLDLSHNSISRIAGLESMGRLQRLSVDHNQLISTKGLRDVSTLLHLDCSHNHLAGVEGLENCVLLSTLDLRSNSLTQPPALNNHVLLRELRLDDNSISSLQELAGCWLPIMQHLSVAQNRITQLPCMSDFVSLENLDLHFNCLSELNNVCQSLQRCRVLREVHLSGNPLTQEPGWRSSLHEAVSSLRTTDGQDTGSLLSPPAVQQLSPASGSFLMLCQLQLQQIQDLQQQHSARLSAASSSLDAVQISCQHFMEALQLAEEHRLAHEYGDTSVCDTHETTVQTIQDSSAEKPSELPHVDPAGRRSPPGCWTSEMLSTEKLYNTVPTRPVMKTDGSTFHPLATERKTCTSKLDLARVSHHQDLHRRNAAAVVIQQRWRKRRQKSGNIYSPPTAEQGGVKGGGGREPAPGPVSVDRSVVSQDYAATVIQAFWRGFALRRRLTSALGAVTCPDTGHDDTFEEVDVDEFVFDEAALEKDWLLSLSEDSASREYLESQQLLAMKPLEPFPGPFEDVLLSSMVQSPKQAWVNREQVDSSPGTSDSDSKSKSPASASASVISGLSQRSERILAEWGFADSHTALLMLKRAQRMKPKKQQQQKRRDPNVPLALFRSCTYQLSPVGARHRPEPQNRCQTQVGEAELELQQAEKSESERVSLQSDQSDGKTESERFLPEISSNVLSGGRVQLVADPGYTKRLHHASSSLSAQPCAGNHYPRRNSLGHERKDIPSPKRVTSAPNKKERISFRDNPVQLSVGWGGGKKRGK